MMPSTTNNKNAVDKDHECCPGKNRNRNRNRNRNIIDDSNGCCTTDKNENEDGHKNHDTNNTGSATATSNSNKKNVGDGYDFAYDGMCPFTGLNGMMVQLAKDFVAEQQQQQQQQQQQYRDENYSRNQSCQQKSEEIVDVDGVENNNENENNYNQKNKKHYDDEYDDTNYIYIENSMVGDTDTALERMMVTVQESLSTRKLHLADGCLRRIVEQRGGCPSKLPIVILNDETTMQQMRHYKKKGNQHFAHCEYQQAIDCYDDALGIACCRTPVQQQHINNDNNNHKNTTTTTTAHTVPTSYPYQHHPEPYRHLFVGRIDQISELVTILSNKSECLLRKYQYEEAIKVATDALIFQSDHLKSRIRRAKGLFQLGKYDRFESVSRGTNSNANPASSSCGGDGGGGRMMAIGTGITYLIQAQYDLEEVLAISELELESSFTEITQAGPKTAQTILAQVNRLLLNAKKKMIAPQAESLVVVDTAAAAAAAAATTTSDKTNNDKEWELNVLKIKSRCW